MSDSAHTHTGEAIVIDNAGTAQLTRAERADLDRLTKIVRKGSKTFIEVGNALMDICQRKLYRETHDTFAAFCEAEFGFKKRHAYRLLSAAKVAAEHPEIDFSSEYEARRYLRGQNAAREGEGEPPAPQRLGVFGGLDRNGVLHAGWSPASCGRYEDMLTLAGETDMTQGMREYLDTLPEPKQRLLKELAATWALPLADSGKKPPARLWAGLTSRVMMNEPKGGVKCANHEANLIAGCKKLVTSGGEVDLSALSAPRRKRVVSELEEAIAALSPELRKIAKDALKNG